MQEVLIAVDIQHIFSLVAKIRRDVPRTPSVRFCCKLSVTTLHAQTVYSGSPHYVQYHSTNIPSFDIAKDESTCFLLSSMDLWLDKGSNSFPPPVTCNAPPAVCWFDASVKIIVIFLKYATDIIVSNTSLWHTPRVEFLLTEKQLTHWLKKFSAHFCFWP